MIKPENTPPDGIALSIPVKKAWNNGPELVLIGNDNIRVAKSHPQVFEATGSAFVHSSKNYFTNNASYSFQGTKYQAAS